MKLYFIFLLLIILSTTLPVKSSITFEEPQPETPSTPRVLNTAFYDDGTIVVRIVRVNYTTPSSICVEERLSIRTVYPNGTTKGFDLSSDTLDIQPFNFCLLPQFNPLRFYSVKENLLLITYVIAEDVNNPYTYNDWGMIIDLDGVIRSKARLSSSFVNTTTNIWLPAQDSITLNVHRDNGFLRMVPKSGTNYLILQQFVVDENDVIQTLAETYLDYNASPIEAAATMDGGYAIIFPDYEPITSTFDPYMSIKGFFLQNGNPEKQGPFVLYQTQNQISNIILLDCDFTKVGYGQTCILVFNAVPATNQNTFVKIDFLSTGTVYNTTVFQNPADLTDFSIQALDYGGYFLFSTTQPSSGSNLDLYGYILDDHGNRYNWNLPYPSLTDEGGSIFVLPNNTLVIPQPEVGQTWSLLTTDLYKIESARDHGYGNLHIFATTPNISDVIDPSQFQTLTVKYYDKVDLTTNRNVTILQDDGSGHGIIRQTASSIINNGDFIKAIDDYTIQITVIDSTFNQPNTKYYVKIDDGFVKSRDLQEPILGIQDTAWNFITMPEDSGSKGITNYYEKKVNASSINGKVRLTADATTYFKTFKHDPIKVKEFFDNLTQELANAVPVSPGRITSNLKHEIDTTVSPEQYVISINIKKAKNKTERSVNSVADDLNTLIQNKIVTVIGTGEFTNYLDDQYGYQTIPRWIEENLSSFLISLAVNIAYIILAFWCKTFAIYSCCNAIEKFVTTILFTSVSAGSVENIFESSLFFVTFPFIVNLGFAFRIVFDELMRHDIRKLIDELEHDLKEVDNPTEPEKDNGETKLINKFNRSNSTFTNVVREIRKELVRVKRELEDVNKLTEKLKDVNNKLKDQNRNVKDTVKELKEINDLVGELLQVDDSMKELLEISKYLDKLENSLDKLKKIDEESKDTVIRNIIETFTGSLKGELEKIETPISKIKDELRNVEELKEQIDEAKELINGLEDNDLTKELLEGFDDLKKEMQDFNYHAGSNNDKKSGYEEDDVVEKCLNCVNFTIEIKDKIIEGIQDRILEKVQDRIDSNQQKKYRKLSQWLRDYKDNQVIVITSTILAGVDTSHMELLGSNLRIAIPSINFCCFKTKRIDIDFDAKLSHAAKNSLYWGGIVNLFIDDISVIIIQSYYVSQVVSLGYTPVYTVAKSIIHLFTNLYSISKHKP
ncbi:hypothetical protein RclHR1_05040007 [Rhizophagus clarus]|uniref:Uncharacterized protein n=1 Tax=Rhizophagus clarus TaxID=94130 RepID=A0A2Z6RKJ6_9GLOM|nr:hypothetical protein RclHR1_05040007 [Rhizophagus clarus]GES87511.1 hypothetical protein GLOIN_2v1834901 [Rhizophagus clarus]